ncbi:MAG: hypothetical protein AAFQ87_09365 [Bacteroidota bacterium]
MEITTPCNNHAGFEGERGAFSTEMRSENRAGLYHYSIMLVMSDSQDDFWAKNEPENLLNQAFVDSRSVGFILSGILVVFM